MYKLFVTLGEEGQFARLVVSMEAPFIKNQGQESSIAMMLRIREPILKRNLTHSSM